MRVTNIYRVLRNVVYWGASGVLALICAISILPVNVFAENAIRPQGSIPDLKLQVPFAGSGEVPLVTIENGTVVGTGMAMYFGQLYAWLVTAVAIIAVVSLMAGGMLWLTSRGNTASTKRAKEIITNALAGIVLTLGAYSILYLINPALVQWPVLRLGAVKRMDISIEEIRSQQSSGGGERGVGDANITANITTYDTALKSATAEFSGVDCTLLKAFMFAESGGNPNAQSSVGAQGLIQLMPLTASGIKSRYGITGSSFDPSTNTRMAAAYLKELKANGCNGASSNTQTGCTTSDIHYLAASYNGGPGANKTSVTCQGKTLWQCEANEGYKETRIYAPRVQSNYNKLKANSWGC